MSDDDGDGDEGKLCKIKFSQIFSSQLHTGTR